MRLTTSLPTFEQFVNGSLRNAWVRERLNVSTLKIYVRRIIVPAYWQADFDLANMNAIPPGRGALTAFLDRWEPVYRFRFENIFNARLIEFLKRRGYAVTSNTNPPCMVKMT